MIFKGYLGLDGEGTGGLPREGVPGTRVGADLVPRAEHLAPGFDITS